MSIKINYLTPSDKNKSLLGKMVFLNDYQEPSINFPYFYLGPKSEIINYNNWPDLVPYLYDKKLGFFTTINNVYQYKDTFSVFSFSLNSGELTLNFNDQNSIKALLALYEDRELYYFENNTYNGWNRTITPLNNIDLNNIVYLMANKNYKIESINIISQAQINLKIKVTSLETISLQILNNKNVEFGLYRIENKEKTQAIYYHTVKSKNFSSTDSNNFFGGLRTRSQIIGHSHQHIHGMSHTHTMCHSHEMSNHRHQINHNHSYNDSCSVNYSTLYGPVFVPGPYAGFVCGSQINIVGQQVFDTRTTNNSNISNTGQNNSNTSIPDISTTSFPINNLSCNSTSFNQSKDTCQDNQNTTNRTFKIGDKNIYNSNVFYTYIYGLSYFAGG